MSEEDRAYKQSLEYELFPGDLVWQMHATDGFPLEMSLPILADMRCIPTWEPLMRAAVKDGMALKKIYLRLLPAIREAYGMRHPELADTLKERLEMLMMYIQIKDARSAG